MDARVPDVPRGDKVRLAYPERYRVFHFLKDVEKLSYTGRRERFNAAR
jgi:hypothetical protein